MHIFSVPSRPPSNVTAVSSSANSINVTWGAVPSAHQNGIITGYIVFYKEISALGYSSAATTQRGVTISGLKPATQYAMRVLAYTNNGNGIASERLVLFTSEKGNFEFSYNTNNK